MSTALIYSDEYLKHDTGNHPERRERYLATLDGLMADEDFWNDLIKIAPRAATDEELLRCHAERAVKRVEQACSQATLHGHVALDADTVVSHYSEVAARLAAGGACRAVEAVAGGEAETAFVACRPPGHHATAGRAMGFCLYNNVAVAARYAQAAYPDRIKKVLIVDFDVHHGNGTQDAFWSDKDLFYGSTHQMPLFPGTGALSETGAGNIFNAPLNPLDGSARFREAFLSRILPALHNFGPDVLLISAGFDAHRDDPLAQIELTEEDFAWVTEKLMEMAEKHAGGRVVSTLEGGYNLQALARSTAAHVEVLVQASS